jgi:hypothetical protein
MGGRGIDSWIKIQSGMTRYMTVRNNESRNFEYFHIFQHQGLQVLEYFHLILTNSNSMTLLHLLLLIVPLKKEAKKPCLPWHWLPVVYRTYRVLKKEVTALI